MAGLIIIIGVIIVALITPLANEAVLEDVLSWLTVVSEVISVSFFLTFRLLYYKNILRSVKLSKRTIKK